jgi:LacI family transcriptional regulator
VICNCWADSSEAHFISKQTCPIVEVSPFVHANQIPRVMHDFEQVGALAAQHFSRLGIRQIATCPLFDSRRDLSIARGVARTSRDYGGRHFRITPDLADHPQDTYPALFARDLMQVEGQIGILANYAFLALAIVEACTALKLRIPQDVAIVAVASDAASVPASLVPLSEVSMSGFGLGYLAAQTLQTVMEGGCVPTEQFVAPVGLEVRRSSTLEAVRDPLVREIAVEIRNRHCLPIRIPDIIPQAKVVSRRTAERRFKTVTGISINDAISDARLSTAKRLLRADPDMTLQEVANQSGFSTPQYMCRFLFHALVVADSFSDRVGLGLRRPAILAVSG